MNMSIFSLAVVVRYSRGLVVIISDNSISHWFGPRQLQDHVMRSAAHKDCAPLSCHLAFYKNTTNIKHF